MYVGEKFYSVIQEVNAYCQHVHTIDEKLNHIIFNVLDGCMQNHFLTIYIPEDYPMGKKQSLHFESTVPSITMISLTKVNSKFVI